MTTSSRLGAILRLSLASALGACLLWPGTTAQVNQLKTSSTVNPLPELRGQAAVEHLKREGIYASLAEAVKASLYKAEALPSGDTYRFSNPAQGLRTTFTPSGARVASSRGGRELVIKPIGYGYGRRMTRLDSQKIVARGNRIEHEYAIKESAIRNPQSAIQEWFVNTEAGIEHGFTLPERPPAGGVGDEALRVEMEVGGDFEPRLDAARPAVTFACECGAGELIYDKLKVYDARGREAPARFELKGKRLAVVVEDGEAEYPLTIDPTLALQQTPMFTQQAKLLANDGAALNFFGISVAISGNTAVVGATGADGFKGAAYVFVRDGVTWTQQQKLTTDSAEGDLFGFSVAIDADTVVVGALDAAGADAFQGAAYVFVRGGTTWTQQQKLIAPDGAAEDDFGFSVAIDADTVVVGALDSGGDNIDPGAAYVFVRGWVTWTLQQKLTASTGRAGADLFGISVAIDADTVVVGGLNVVGVNADQGAAYVFVRGGTTWTRQQILTASTDSAVGDQFGRSVAISGDTVVVGALDTGGANADLGAAYVFVRGGTTWTLQQKLISSDGAFLDLFGLSVAIDVDTIVVGAASARIGGNERQGAAYVFVRGGTTWTLQQKLTASDGAALEQFGFSVAIVADTVVVGANGANVDGKEAQGAAYVFTRCSPIAISPETLPNGTVGADYSQTLTATGGTAPFTFTVSSGALPPGLTLSSAGAISGTPTAAGAFSFTVQALDSAGCTGEITYSLKVATRKSKSVSSAGDKPRAATNSAPIARASAGRCWRETERKRSKR